MLFMVEVLQPEPWDSRAEEWKEKISIHHDKHSIFLFAFEAVLCDIDIIIPMYDQLRCRK